MKPTNSYIPAPTTGQKRTTFDMSESHQTSHNMGVLVPIYRKEVLPGDRWRIWIESLIQYSPLLAPVLHLAYLKIWVFYSPNRLVFPQWDKFITLEDEALTGPYFTGADGVNTGSLSDYMGIPVNVPVASTDMRFSALPFAHYALIRDEWFRYQFVMTNEVFTPLVSGNNDAVGSYSTLLFASPLGAIWPKDYFGNCLPEPQRGDPVMIPVGPDVIAQTGVGNAGIMRRSNNDAILNNEAGLRTDSTGGMEGTTSGAQGYYDPNGTLSVDPGTIEMLKLARITQHFRELLQHGGQRITEFTHTFWGTQVPDLRVNIPQYVGSIQQRVKISTVMSTTETLTPSDDSVANVVGSKQGTGFVVSSGQKLTFSASEYGYVMAIAEVCAEPVYGQGLEQLFDREAPSQYPLPMFSVLGEEGIKQREIYAEGATLAENENTWGYLERFFYFKTGISRATGEFRTTTLDFWNWYRKFTTAPVLNESFMISGKSNFDRTFAVVSSVQDQLQAHYHITAKVDRKLPFTSGTLK